MDEIKRILRGMCRQDMNKAVAQISEFICKENALRRIEEFMDVSFNEMGITEQIKISLTDCTGTMKWAILHKEENGVKWEWEK